MNRKEAIKSLESVRKYLETSNLELAETVGFVESRLLSIENDNQVACGFCGHKAPVNTDGTMGDHGFQLIPNFPVERPCNGIGGPTLDEVEAERAIRRRERMNAPTLVYA